MSTPGSVIRRLGTVANVINAVIQPDLALDFSAAKLDLFLGSGTTLMPAERTGRPFRGLDIDPAYVDVAIERWFAKTGF